MFLPSLPISGYQHHISSGINPNLCPEIPSRLLVYVLNKGLLQEMFLNMVKLTLFLGLTLS